jgi:hypothetical protein
MDVVHQLLSTAILMDNKTAIITLEDANRDFVLILGLILINYLAFLTVIG